MIVYIFTRLYAAHCSPALFSLLCPSFAKHASAYPVTEFNKLLFYISNAIHKFLHLKHERVKRH
jgi:hypothetical protein